MIYSEVSDIRLPFNDWLQPNSIKINHEDIINNKTGGFWA
jgi:hypothetical protein